MKQQQNKVHFCLTVILFTLGSIISISPSTVVADTDIDYHPKACIAPQLKIPAWTNSRGWDSEAYQSTIALANVTADADLELLGRDTEGVAVHVFYIDPKRGWWGAWQPKYSADYRQPDLADPEWTSPDRYSTIRYLDLNGDGVDEMVALESGDKGLGLLAFSFKGGDGQSSGNWELLNENGYQLPANTDWTSNHIYTGFRVGKVLEGNAEQLLIRSQSGIIGFSWDPVKANFELLADPANKGFFKSWFEAKYYATIRAADVDGDGLDEIIGRSAAGLMAIKYVPDSGWQLYAQPNEILNNKEAGWEGYYKNMIWGHFLNKNTDSLAIWTKAGIQLISLNTKTKTWQRHIKGTALLPDKHDPLKHPANLRAADINNDGKDDLHWNYYYNGAINSYSFDTTTKQWQLLNTGNTDEDRLMLDRLHMAEYGDIDGDGISEAIGRSRAGIVTYFYDPEKKRWDENFSCGLPAFTGGQAKVYAVMNKMQFGGSTEFRHRYNDKDNSSNITFLDNNKKRPDDKDPSYTQKDWAAVREQLLDEFAWTKASISVFEGQRDAFNDQYISQWQSMDTTGNKLLTALNEEQTINITAILLDLATAGVDALTEGVASKIFKKTSFITKGLAKGASMLLGAGVEAIAAEVFPEKPVIKNVDDLKDLLLGKQESSKTHLNTWAQEITGLGIAEGDLGTMAAVAKLHQDGYWPANFSTAAFLEDKTRWVFKRWLYQQIITSIYEVHIYDCASGIFCPEETASRTRVCYQHTSRGPEKMASTNCFKATIGRSWVYRAIEKTGDNWEATLPDEVNSIITSKLSEECKQDGGYSVDQCNLSIPMNDLLFMSEGWNLGLKNTSTFVGNDSTLKNKLSCGGLDATIIGDRKGGIIYGTPEADVILAFDGDDVIYSGGGNDIICASGGNDRVYAGPGDDIIILGSGDDYAAGGDGNDRLYGDLGKDILLGEDGDDILMGGPDYDILDGGAGMDTLYGGPQAEANKCVGEITRHCEVET